MTILIRVKAALWRFLQSASSLAPGPTVEGNSPLKILFDSGRITITSAAAQLLEERKIDYTVFLERHFSGIWGDLNEYDWEQNNAAVDNAGRIFSCYNLESGALWIITEWDRSATTILLPDDY